MGTFNNMTGKRFGRLLVTGKHEVRNKHGYWLCRCDCNNLHWVAVTNLMNGHSKSCGCLNKEITSKRSKTHGQSKTPTYSIWKGMHKRCKNPKDKNFKNYGGRGISVCPEWSAYEVFYRDMGERPSNKHSIDRKDNEKGYSSDNCQWATQGMQSNNSRANILITHNGVTKTVSEWSDLSPVAYNTFWQRLYTLNWSIEKALSLLNILFPL